MLAFLERQVQADIDVSSKRLRDKVIIFYVTITKHVNYKHGENFVKDIVLSCTSNHTKVANE